MWRSTLLGFVAVVLLFLVSCWGGQGGNLSGLDSLRNDVAQLQAELAGLSRDDSNVSPDRFTFQLLHASDMDGSTGALQNVENFSAILTAFRAQFPDNTLVVSSGDNFIPRSPLLRGSRPGERVGCWRTRKRPRGHRIAQCHGLSGLSGWQP